MAWPFIVFKQFFYCIKYGNFTQSKLSDLPNIHSFVDELRNQS
ncbi:hypothetical protein HMPREF9370_1196 [Neisseria wadsworthii 9715]|uniref:Uncharacterized protein n=1 Tax=Neisseria wadsworthii 9715 TaxID=1030841 RepID=G4CQ36_9NEIS|nr:hypothetical protein HMPREF9370_1196 [Neisseria wadsworthii 9715]